MGHGVTAHVLTHCISLSGFVTLSRASLCARHTVLFGLGDILAQGVQYAKVEGSKRGSFGINWRRLAEACSFGVVVSGPANHYHLNFLEWLSTKVMKLPRSGMRMPLFKMFVEQFVYFSYFMCGAYHVWMTYLHGGNLSDAKATLEKVFWPTVYANWMFWPAVQLVNFKLVPVPWQLNFVLAASVLWAMYLSYSFQGDEEGTGEGGDGGEPKQVEDLQAEAQMA